MRAARSRVRIEHPGKTTAVRLAKRFGVSEGEIIARALADLEMRLNQESSGLALPAVNSVDRAAAALEGLRVADRERTGAMVELEAVLERLDRSLTLASFVALAAPEKGAYLNDANHPADRIVPATGSPR